MWTKPPVLAGLLLISALSVLGPAQAFSHDELYVKGEQAMTDKDYDSAIDFFIRAKQADLKDDRARYQLAGAYEAEHRYSEAEREYDDLCQLYPANTMWPQALAHCYLDQSEYYKALNVFQDCLGKDPNDVNSLLGAAVCLESVQDLDSAKDYYSRVIVAAPNTQPALAAANRLSRLAKATTARDQNQFFPLDDQLGRAGFGWWDYRKPIHVYVDDGSSLPNFHGELLTHVLHALEAWSGASNGKLAFIIDPPDPVNEARWKQIEKNGAILAHADSSWSTMPPDPVTSSIHIHWAENVGHALGITWTDVMSNTHKENSEITKAHIWLATNRMSDGRPLPTQVTTDNAQVFESHDRMMQYVTLHEFGHAFGLPHSSNPSDVMVGGVFALNSLDSASTKQLSIRDIASLNEHYSNFDGTITANHPATRVSPSDFRPKLTTGDVTAQDEVARWQTAIEETGHSLHTTGYNPLRDAARKLQNGNSSESIEKLKQIIDNNPQNAQAHYLLGVAFVTARKYADARAQYNEVLKLAQPNSELSRFAREGLNKLGR